MTRTVIQHWFKPIRQFLPSWISNPIRSVATAILTPLLFSYRSGHFKSSFKMAAVSKSGEPLPWYTYPCIDFLRFRDFENKTVLEFGGGQSSMWWGKRARKVVTFEADKDWFEKIGSKLPDNVDLHLVSMQSRSICVEQIDSILSEKAYPQFDIVVIDGLYREEMITIANRVVAGQGIIICDNADGYGFYEGFKDRGLARVDFFGYAPGVVLPHCTSIFYRPACFLFDAKIPIPVIVKEQ